MFLTERTDGADPVTRLVLQSSAAIIFAVLPPSVAATFFMLTWRSEGTSTQTGLPK